MKATLLALLPLLLLGACSGHTDTMFQGYVEGDFIDVAPEVGGRIVDLAVRRGAGVGAGDLLFTLDDSEAKAAVAQSEAQVAQAEAELQNLREGERPPEIAVIDAQIAEANATLDKARRDFARQRTLYDKKVVSAAALDEAQESIRTAQARLAATERQKEVALLPARTPEIAAGERAVEAAEAALTQTRAQLAKYVVTAPASGRIEDTYYDQGEVAAAGAPILSLLPVNKRKVIFYVPEPERPSLAIGSSMSIACDRCAAGLTATLTFLGTEAEFTPPVIFSRENRGKLMFRAEAALEGEGANLPLGQPVDVAPALRGAQ